MNPINGIWQWVIQGRYGIPQEGLGRPDANYSRRRRDLYRTPDQNPALRQRHPSNNRSGPGPAPSVPGYHLDEGVGGAPRDNARPCRARHRPPRHRPHPPEKPLQHRGGGQSPRRLECHPAAILAWTWHRDRDCQLQDDFSRGMLANCRFRLGTFDVGEQRDLASDNAVEHLDDNNGEQFASSTRFGIYMFCNGDESKALFQVPEPAEEGSSD